MIRYIWQLRYVDGQSQTATVSLIGQRRSSESESNLGQKHHTHSLCQEFQFSKQRQIGRPKLYGDGEIY